MVKRRRIENAGTKKQFLIAHMLVCWCVEISEWFAQLTDNSNKEICFERKRVILLNAFLTPCCMVNSSLTLRQNLPKQEQTSFQKLSNCLVLIPNRTFLYASATYQASLVEPWFVFKIPMVRPN